VGTDVLDEQTFFIIRVEEMEKIYIYIFYFCEHLQSYMKKYLYDVTVIIRSQDSSVGIATGYVLDN
jgi:hypothetical protein